MMKQLLNTRKQPNTNRFTKILCAITMVLLVSFGAKAQVSAYSADEEAIPGSSGIPYSPFAMPSPPATQPNVLWYGSGTATNINDVKEINLATLTVPMTFKYNGVSYSKVFVSSNGFVFFQNGFVDTNTVYDAVTQPIAYAGGYAGAISLIGADFGFGPNTQGVYFEQVNESGNVYLRICFQGQRYNPGVINGVITGFINLYADSHATEPNTIRLEYNTSASINVVNNPGFQLGLRGVNNTAAEVLAYSNPQNVAWPADWNTTSQPNNVSTSTVNYGASMITAASARRFWFRPVSCTAPTALTAAPVTHNAATVSYTASTSSPTDYQYELLNASSVVVSSGTTAGTSANFTSLTPGATYTFRVRSNCSGSYSPWVTLTFTTLCDLWDWPAYNGYYQVFESGVPTVFTPPAIPQCNSVALNGPNTTNWVTSSATVASIANGFTDEHLQYVDPPGAANANAYYFTQGIPLEAGKTYRLTYVYGGTYDNILAYNEMKVSIGSVPTHAGMQAGVVLKDYNNAAGTAIRSSPNREILNFTVPSNGGYYLGFYAYSPDGKGTIYLDEIIIVEETCFAPNLGTASGITTTGATIPFTNVMGAPPAGGYEYIVSTSNIVPAQDAIPTGALNSGASSIVLTGLVAGTTYYVFIRSNCGSQYSMWNQTSFATTPILAPTLVVMTNNSNTQSACSPSPTSNSVLFTDSGGTTGNYTNNENRVYTFTAAAGYQVKAVFTAFSTENRWDALRIYNGSTTAPATMINSGLGVGYNATTAPAGSFYGTNSPGTIISTNGALTFQFTSDGSVLYSGWQVVLSCVQVPIVTSFTPNNNDCGRLSTPVTITGVNFPTSSMPVVTFGGIPGTVLTYTSTQITAMAPATAQSGPIGVGNGVDFGYSSGIFTVKPAPPVGVDATVCQGDVTPTFMTSPTMCEGYYPIAAPNNNVLSGSWTSSSPTAVRPNTSTNSTNCAFSTNMRSYDMIEFQVSQNGLYVFTLNNASPNQDSMGYIVRAPFTPGTCSPNFVIGDDDSAGGLLPRITVNLQAGVTYYLISTTWNNTNVGTYSWLITPPAGGAPLVPQTGAIRWYVSNTAPTHIFEGSSFNPVGHPGSGITDTNTAGVHTFYAACSNNPDCREPVDFVISAGGTIDIDQTPGPICPNAPTALTYTGTATNVVWTSTVPNTLFTDQAGLVPYDGTSHAATIYVKSNVNVTVNAAGGGAASACTGNDSIALTTSIKTWNGASWVGGAPTINDGAVFAGNYSTNADVTACSCTVNSGANVIIQSGRTMTLQNGLTVQTGGSMTFENNASLLQISETASNTGGIVYKRTTTPMKQYDYTYWSSPVSPQTLVGVSPATLSDKYYEYSNSLNQYVNVAGNSLMETGKGYLIRAPQPGVAVAPYAAWAVNTTYTAMFSGASNNGVPNNGTYSNIPIRKNGTNLMNLIGNPYPSAFDANRFMGPSTPNAGKVGGTMYFWTHNTVITNGQYIGSDYAVYNLNGGIGTAPGGGSGNVTVPNGYVAAGQGFFMEAIASDPNGVKYATFNNSMRVAGNNSTFFRQQNSSNSRIWVDLTNSAGAFKQTMVGYLPDATTGWDIYYDSRIIEGDNEVSLYSIADEERLAIQGRPAPLDINDIVPLGYRVTTAGDYTVSLSNFDGIFTDQDVFLEDLYLNTAQNLKLGSYNFNSASGIFEDRFVIRYEYEALSIGDDNFNSNTVLAYKSQDKIVVKSSNVIIDSVRIYDVRGRLLLDQNNVQNNHIEFTDLSYANQMLLVQIKSVDGVVVTKKILF